MYLKEIWFYQLCNSIKIEEQKAHVKETEQFPIVDGLENDEMSVKWWMIVKDKAPCLKW